MSGSTAFQAEGTISANSVTRSQPGVFEEQYDKERLVEMMLEKSGGGGYRSGRALMATVRTSPATPSEIRTHWKVLHREVM